MDAINTQTRDNLGSIIPTSQNVPLKEDLEFLPKTTTKSSVKLLRRLAILAAIVSTFGLVSNEIAFYHFSSFYNFTCTFTSLASLIISSALIFWSTKTLNHEEGNTDAVPTRRWELFNQALYTTLLFRTAISIPLITNMFFYGDNTSHHLRAIEATYQDGTVSSTENALRSIAPVLPFFEVLLSLTFVQAARTVFPYIREQTSTMTRMVFIGSAVLMASSFGMLYALRYASDYQDLYGQPFPSWNIGGLVFLGIVSSIVAGLVWTVNHTKWRAPYTIVAGVLAASTLGLALFSTLSYNNSQNIASLYGDMNNLHTWSEQMAATNKEELRTIGCPTKYLPKSIANDPSFDAFWGPGATTKDGLPTKYLNIACVELLGSQQASYFAEATTYGLLTAASGLIILIGFLYFNHTQWRDVGERNKKDFRWLLVLGAIALTFNVAMIMYDAPLPSENAKLALNSISNSNVYFVDDAAAADATAADATAADATATDATTTTADAAPAASGDSTTANTQVDVGDRYTAAFNDLTSKRFRFMVFKHDSIIPGQVNIEAGPWNWEFLDFANTFAPNEQQVGFIMLGDEGKEKPFMVIFAPQDTATKDVLDGFGLPYNTQDFQRAGLPDASNYVARTKKDLDFNSILGQSNSGIVAIFADDAPADASAADATTADATATDATATDATATDATATDATTTTADAAPADSADSAAAAPDASGDSTATSSTQVSDRYKAAFNDLTSKRFRFMIFKRDPTIPLRVNIEAGPWEWEFIDFTNALNAAEQQVGFVMIGENGKERPYMVVYAPGGAPVKDVLDLFSLPYNTGDLVNAGLSGLTYFVANTKKQLDEATVVGQSQAGTLVLSDNTMILATANSINSVYNQTIQDLVSRKSRFVVFKHDTKDPWRINLVIGNQNAIFSDFNLAFDEGREQVGIMYVGQGSSVQPYLVVLAPGYKTASQVLDGFELPTNSSEYEKLGLKRLNYYVAKERKEITLTTVVMKGQAGGRISLYQFEEGQWEAPELEDNGGEYDDEPAIFAESDPNPYGIILKALDNKKYRFAILKSDPNNPMNVKVAAAPWKWGFNDFVANIDPAQEQIGFITLGPKGAEKPYMIVYAPSATTTARSVLNRFSVPTSTEDLQKAGLSGASYYVARKIEDLDLNAIATQSQAGSVGILLAYEEESDEPEDEQDQGAFEGQDDQQEQSDQEQSDHDGSSGDSNEDGSTEITAIDDAAAEDSTGSEDVPVFQAVTNNPYAGLFNGLNDKKYRFIVLKHDPNDPMAVKISGGPWKMTFQDFLNSIDQNREQVAFVYIGPTYSEKLYRVVVAPSVLNSNAAYVVDGFQLPRDSKGLAQLGLKGVPTYVAGSKSDLTEQKIITYGKASV